MSDLGHSHYLSQKDDVLGSLNSLNESKNEDEDFDSKTETHSMQNMSADLIRFDVDDLATTNLAQTTKSLEDLSRGALSKRRIKNIDLVLRRRRQKKLDPVNNPVEFEFE